MTEPATRILIDLPDEAATIRLAEDIAAAVGVGDVLALQGDLGAGKTTLARAMIRAIAGDPDLEVPSPTFTLVQTYEGGAVPVSHFDLYRIADPDETDEIGLAAAAEDTLVLVEWPERAGHRLPEERITITLGMAGTGRHAEIVATPHRLAAIRRALAARAVMDRAGLAGARRSRLAGDASARRYERIAAETGSAVLMDWPPAGQLAPDDPRARFRAGGAATFVAVAEALRGAGVSVPRILAADVAAGLVVMEDFGTPGLAPDGNPDADAYAAAVDVLAALHAVPRPERIPSEGGWHVLPSLTGAALQAELTLFADAYAARVRGMPLDAAARAGLAAIWTRLDGILQETQQGWVLFDVQSPNLFRLPGGGIGIIDFQDMFYGPVAYDVASLVNDARVAIPESLGAALLDRYRAARARPGGNFDAEAFDRAFAITAALRHSKNLGAFAALVSRGKTSYASHLPGSRAYLERALSHPVLSELSVWYDTHLIPEIQVR